MVRFDAQRLGGVAGRRLVHLQCHIGTDTLSWAKLGAQVTGVDFSPAALAAARRLAADSGGRVLSPTCWNPAGSCIWGRDTPCCGHSTTSVTTICWSCATPTSSSQSLRWVAAQTYTGDEDELAHPVTYEWNHGLADIITAILDAGLILTSFQEHRHADWKALASMVEGPTATGACRRAPSACR